MRPVNYSLFTVAVAEVADFSPYIARILQARRRRQNRRSSDIDVGPARRRLLLASFSRIVAIHDARSVGRPRLSEATAESNLGYGRLCDA